MDRLLELLARLTDLTDDERTELDALLTDALTPGEDGRFPDLTDEQVEAYLTASRAAAQAIADSDTPDLEMLTRLVESHETIEAEASTRVEEAEAQAAAVAELVSRVAANDPVASDTPPDDDGDGDDGDDETEVEAVTEPEVVTAAAPRRPRAPLGSLRQNRRTQTAPEPAEPTGRRMYAGASLTSLGTGTEVEGGIDTLSDAIAESIGRHRSATNLNLHLARFSTEYPVERQLSASDARLNLQLVERVHQSAITARENGATDSRFEALVAAGGLCAPLAVRYDQDVLGTTERPVAGALGGFDASRGGVRYIPSPVLTDIGREGQPGDTDNAVGIWTMADDEAADASDPATYKSIQRVECGEEETATLYLVTARLQVGNIMAMTWPERVRAIIRLASIAYARTAEQALLDRIEDLSTTVTGFGGVLGTARDAIAEWATAAHSLRVQNRVGRDTPVRVIAPEALRTSIIIDIARQLPGDNAMGRALEYLNGVLTDIGVVVTWSPDMIIPALEDGTLAPIPTTIDYALFLEGTFDFADGLNLDLGFESGTPIRDTRLNAVNEYELFMEGGEQVAKFGGHQALWVEAEFCPTGATAGTTDVTCD